MSQTLGIKFNDYGQVYYFSSGPFVVAEGQHVIVKTDQGMGLGKVVLVRQAPAEDEVDEGHKPIYRLAKDKDLEAVEENKVLSKEAFSFCRKCIDKLGLGMKLVDVEVFFDRSKMVFYFTAPGRIDFRELIKDLVREFRTRIELRQIGVRHETQMLGALGNCGQLCCCRRFLRKFAPVTIKMAKEQNLFLNPTKISGICGRLLCCLSYEQEGYEEFHSRCPRIGKKYRTSLGTVKVLRSNFFKKTLSLLQENYEEQEIPIDEWEEIVNKPPSEETLAALKAAPGRRGGRSGRPQRPPQNESKDETAQDAPDENQASEGSGDPANQEAGSEPVRKKRSSAKSPRAKRSSEGVRKPRRSRRRRRPPKQDK